MSGKSSLDETQLAAERNKHEAWLNGQPGLSGTGIGIGRDGNRCIKIFTNGMQPETKQAIAARLGHLPVEFEETGEFRPF